MNRKVSLNQLSIASPCHENWDAMSKDGSARRFCDQCSKHVHDLSKLTRSEAQRLVDESAGGSICIRMQRDPQGRLVTLDYASPPSRAPRWYRWFPVAAVFAVASGVATFLFGSRAWASEPSPPPTMGAMRPPPQVEVMGRIAPVEMGDVAPPTTRPATTQPAATQPTTRPTGESGSGMQ